jgi:hypothetical protein
MGLVASYMWSGIGPVPTPPVPHRAGLRRRIVHTTPTEQEASFSQLRAMISGGGMGRGGVQAGETLTQLFVNGVLWMSDTRDERRDHWTPRHRARGTVLIGGLGFGMVALAAALKPEVDKVIVIEINPTIIELVLPHLRAALEGEGVDPDKLVIIQADLMEWKPPKGEMYDCIWFDIWPTLCEDNLEEMAKLNRRYGRRTQGYRGSWGENLLKARRDRDRRQGRSGWW